MGMEHNGNPFSFHGYGCVEILSILRRNLFQKIDRPLGQKKFKKPSRIGKEGRNNPSSDSASNQKSIGSLYESCFSNSLRKEFHRPLSFYLFFGFFRR
jgi:hypothetical protein